MKVTYSEPKAKRNNINEDNMFVLNGYVFANEDYDCSPWIFIAHPGAYQGQTFKAPNPNLFSLNSGVRYSDDLSKIFCIMNAPNTSIYTIDELKLKLYKK